MNTSNYINLIGRLGKDPVRKTLPSGNEVLEISLATNNFYKDRNGERVKQTDWHNVKCYTPAVIDILQRYVQKGSQLSVVGAMRYRTWTDKYEQTRREADVILDSFSFIGGGRPDEDGKSANHGYEPVRSAASPQMPQPTYVSMEEEPAMMAEGDLPF